MAGLSRRTLINTSLLASSAVVMSAGTSMGEMAPTLSSWADGQARKNIVDFVSAVSRTGSADFVPPEGRIAVFDNDGTLWCEQPMYVQLAFALDRVKALLPEHPEWETTEPYKSALSGDLEGLVALGQKAILEIIASTHAGMTTEAFYTIVADWIATAQHSRFKRPYTSTIFQPMLELIAYLKYHDFQVFIVSGGGVEFMRPWATSTYGIPPENVVGSSIKSKYEVRDGKPVIIRLPEIDFVDDGAGKPVGINKFIGHRPIAAFGNSDGDFEMLEWTTSAPGKRFGLIVHHDDGEREYAYDRQSHVGKLDRGLDEAPKRGWTVVSMKSDWKQIYPE